jgi:hypothetical protein
MHKCFVIITLQLCLLSEPRLTKRLGHGKKLVRRDNWSPWKSLTTGD